ncbi:MAG TPA: alpha/beta hydrolase [Candidatus Sulfotelmatobacter sp.]|nr:alpha/beta hydrolase [Candidatus Sulfotelmatobacter sp.]
MSLAPPRADARVAYGSDANQFIDLRMPKASGAYPLAICIHGGYWRARYDLEYLGHLGAALKAKGVATANVEYRRVGNAGGGWPGTFEDIRAAYQFLLQNAQRYGFDTRRVIVLGHSAGGQLALCLAARESGLAGAVSLAGVVDLQQAYDLHLSNDAVVEFLGGKPAEVPEHYREADPMKLAIRARQWLVHGARDEIVPPALSKNYVDAKVNNKEDARLVAIAGAGHFDVVDPRSAAWAEVENILVDGLGKA